MLPDVHGIEVCRRLREWSEMPIIVLSALGEEQIKIAALEHGADDYVTKPFGTGELVARLQAALRRAGRGVAEPRIEVDGLVIDLAAHAVWLDGEEVRLTPIEFSLLRVLAVNRGLLMTHRQLLSEVWGPEHADARRCCAPTSRTCARSCRPVTRSRRLSGPMRGSAIAFAHHDGGRPPSWTPPAVVAQAPGRLGRPLWRGLRLAGP